MFTKLPRCRYLQKSSASFSESFPLILRRFSADMKQTKVNEELLKSAVIDASEEKIGFKPYIIQREIDRRDPSLFYPLDPFRVLIHKLKGLADASPGLTEDLMSLEVKYFSNFQDVPIEKLLKVLEHYVDPYNVTQANIHYLSHYKRNIEEFWKIITNNADSLTFPQMLTVFQSMKSIHTIFSKKFSAKNRLPWPEIVDDLLGKSLKLIQNEDFNQICSLIVAAQALNTTFFTDNIRLLQKEMTKRVKSVESMDLKTLTNVAYNLSEGFYLENQEVVSEIKQKVLENANSLWIGDLVKALVGIHRSGARLDFKFGIYLGNLTSDYLDELHPHELTELVKALSNSNLFSEFIAKETFKVYPLFRIPKHLGKPTEATSEIISAIYEMNKGCSVYSSINSSFVYIKLSDLADSLPLESLLKYSILILPADTSNSYSQKVFKYIMGRCELNSEEIQKNLPLIIEFQDLLIETLKEYPIYSYQLLSYEPFPGKYKFITSKCLNKVLKQYCPDHPLVFKYLFEININDESVSAEDFKVKLTLDNFLWVSKCLWKYRPGPQAYENVFRFLEDFKQAEVDLTEAFYYLISSTKEKIPVFLNLIKVNSPFYLPLSFETGIFHANKEEILQGLNENGLYGEALVKTLIVCVENRIFLEMIKKLSQNLGYFPSNQEKFDMELVRRLILGIIDSKIPVDLHAFSLFIRKFYLKLESKDKTQVRNFVLPLVSEIHPDLLEFIELRVEKSISDTKKYIEQLKKDKNASIHNKKTLKFLVDLLGTEMNKSETLRIISALLDFYSIVGDEENNFKVIYDLIGKNKLFNELSENDLENYFYLLMFGKSQLSASKSELDKLKHQLNFCEDEKLFLNESRNLKYYKSFKYNTEYENRHLVRNFTNDLNHIHSLFNTDYSLDEFYAKLKQIQLLKHLNLPVPESHYLQVNLYFSKAKHSKMFIKAKTLAKDTAIVKMGLKPLEYNLKLQFPIFSNLFDSLLTFERNNAGILILDTAHFIKIATDNNLRSISSPMKFLTNYLSELTKLEIFTYDSKNLIECKNPETHSFMAMLKKHKLR